MNSLSMALEEENLSSLHMEPPKIHRLSESVINRIAAGEVIQRPVSAVKELIENSLDAGSTSINVTVKDGGLKLIQVSDNGHGIRSEDLPILCERHTTSKLSTYEDLQTIKSMGFRGEALASMTYVGHVTVTTITEGQLHGYRTSYKDGAMEHEPKACAAVRGTQIMIENLFYNMTARRKTLQSSDDYPKIVDIVSRFSIHHVVVSFSCRKHGANRPDVHTMGAGSKLDAIKSVYGLSVSSNLIEITCADTDPTRSVFTMSGFISNANYVAKKTIMILFVNDRLVDCTVLKRAIEVVYAATLPKASKPFIYMSIQLPLEHVDVNIHPTKREVSLLNQEAIVDAIQEEVDSRLRSCNTTRTFRSNSVYPSNSAGEIKKDQFCPPRESRKQKVPVNKIVRTDSQDPFGRMHTYLQDKRILLSGQKNEKSNLSCVRSAIIQRRHLRETADLSSVQELVSEIDSDTHAGLLEIIKDCSYVGMADDTLALLQHDTRLYLANIVNLSKELIYQQVLRRFAHFNGIQLSNPAPLFDLIMLALKEEVMESNDVEDEVLNDRTAKLYVGLLMQKAEMLQEYFCIHIDEHGHLSKLPVILDQYTPSMDGFPEFALSLSNDVKWTDEKECFQTIAAVLANFYAAHPPFLPNPSGEGLPFYRRMEKESIGGSREASETEGSGDLDEELLAEAETAWAQREWTIQHVLFPSMRLFLKPPKCMATNGTFVQVASLEKLYKIFERC